MSDLTSIMAKKHGLPFSVTEDWKSILAATKKIPGRKALDSVKRFEVKVVGTEGGIERLDKKEMNDGAVFKSLKQL